MTESTVMDPSTWRESEQDGFDLDGGMSADDVASDAGDLPLGDTADGDTQLDVGADDALPTEGEENPWIVIDSGPDRPPPETDGGVQPASPFSFVVFGDNQFATDSCTSGIPERRAVPLVVMEWMPDFVVHTGDLVDHAYEEGAYDNLVDCYREMLDTLLFFPTMGNHDAGGGGILNYKDYLEWQLFEQNPLVYPMDYEVDFPLWYEDDPTDWSTDRSEPSDRDLLPSGVTYKTYYAFRHENAYFISFEQGTRWWTQTPKPWLEQHLSEAYWDPSIEYIFVYMHHPMYSTIMPETASGECIEPVRSHYEGLFRQYDVTLVFSGHVHSYDRFYVPDDGSPTREDPPPEVYPHDGLGIHYLVTGGGGGGLTNGCDPFPLREELSYAYSQARGCFHHVVRVEVDRDGLRVSVVRIEGGAADYTTTLQDSFRIE